MERERRMFLCSSAPEGLDAQPTSPKTPEISKVLVNKSFKWKHRVRRRNKKDAKEQQVCDGGNENAGNESDANCGQTRAKSETKRKSEEENHVTTEQTQPDSPLIQSAQAECEYCFFSQFYLLTLPSA